MGISTVQYGYVTSAQLEWKHCFVLLNSFIAETLAVSVSFSCINNILVSFKNQGKKSVFLLGTQMAVRTKQEISL